MGADITLVQLEEYQDKNPASDLMGKDIVWFAGGSAGYLLYWMGRTKLNENIKEILNKTTNILASDGPIFPDDIINFFATPENK